MVRVLAEEFEVLAVVEQVEKRFILARRKQIRAEARAAPQHLPELGFRAHHLEEDQIEHFRHIDAGVEHIDRERNVRHLLLVGEVVNQALRIFGFVRHYPGEMALVVRVVDIETLGNKFGVGVVLGEDNGLAEPVAASHLLAPGHQVRQHLIDGVGVEQPFIERSGIHFIGRRAILVPLQRIPLLLFIIGKVIVFDAFTLEFEGDRYGLGWHQIAITYRIIQRVGVGRYAGFQVEQAVGVVVDFVLGGGRQANQQRIEVFKNGAVLLIHRAVRLVDDNEVEVTDTETALAGRFIIRGLINQTHHRRVGGNEHPALGMLLGDQIDRR